MKRFFDNLFGTRQTRQVRRPAAFKPTLEALEDRRLLSVTAVGPAEDFNVHIDGGETVQIGRSTTSKLRVTADGQDLPVQQAASSIVKLTINADNNRANTIDLAGIDLADFTQLSQVLVKIDARDTVQRGPDWNAAGSELIGGQRYAVFTQGNAALKVTDLAPAAPPMTPPMQSGGITASLLNKKVGGRQNLFVQVRDAGTGQVKAEFASPFKSPACKRITASVRDSNGDGVMDTVVLTARRGKRALSRTFAV